MLKLQGLLLGCDVLSYASPAATHSVYLLCLCTFQDAAPCGGELLESIKAKWGSPGRLHSQPLGLQPAGSAQVRFVAVDAGGMADLAPEARALMYGSHQAEHVFGHIGSIKGTSICCHKTSFV